MVVVRHKTRTFLNLFVVVGFLLSLFLPQLLQSVQATDDSIWVNNKQINVSLQQEIAAGDMGCRKTTIKTQHYKWSYLNTWDNAYPVYTNICAVLTPIGLIGDGYVWFAGTEYAQKVWNGGADMSILPIPGQRAVIVGAGAGGIIKQENSVQIYYNLAGVGKSVITGSGERKFQVMSFPDPLRDQTGKILPLYNFAFSSDGEWALAVARDVIMRIHIPTKAMQTIGKAYYGGGFGYTMAISNDGRYAYVEGTQSFYSTASVFDLVDCVASQETTITGDVQTGCKKRSITNELQSQIPGFSSLISPQFSYDNNVISAVAHHRKPTDTNWPSGFRRIEIANQGYSKPAVAYLGLGDSFASGEGDNEGDKWYEPGTDNNGDTGIKNKCHVSRRSYPYLIASQLGFLQGVNTTPSDDSQFHSVACSGARSINILSGIQHNEGEGAPYWKSGTKNQSFWVHEDTPDSITISTIGNDIGFGKKITRCLMPDTCYESYEDRMEIAKLVQRQFSTLTTMYGELKKASPSTKIYVLGYPQIISTSGSCAVNVRLNQTEREFAVQLTHYLNGVIKAAAQYSGVEYVDVEDIFTNKELCSGLPQELLAVNGITRGNDSVFGQIGAESFHPNFTGQQLYATRVMNKTEALTKPMPSPDESVRPPEVTNPAYAGLIDAPKTGRQLVDVNYDESFTNDTVYLSKKSKIILKGPVPYAAYRVVLHSDPKDLGLVVANEEGIIDAEIQIPADVEPGIHTIDIIGKDLAGQNTDIQKIVYVAASESDLDGDGIPNDQEKCGFIDQLDVDVDQDGIDDACDLDIGPAPITPKEPSDPGTGDGDEQDGTDDGQGATDPNQDEGTNEIPDEDDNSDQQPEVTPPANLPEKPADVSADTSEPETNSYQSANTVANIISNVAQPVVLTSTRSVAVSTIQQPAVDLPLADNAASSVQEPRVLADSDQQTPQSNKPAKSTTNWLPYALLAIFLFLSTLGLLWVARNRSD